jgi:hypothetical protein
VSETNTPWWETGGWDFGTGDDCRIRLTTVAAGADRGINIEAGLRIHLMIAIATSVERFWRSVNTRAV